MVEHTCFWDSTISRSETKIIDAFPEKCDVLIIGGGFNGISAAYHLNKMGAKVVVLEAKHVGWGASGRNGGMALTGLKESASTLISKYGIKKAKEFFDHSLVAVDLVKNLVRDENLQPELLSTGHIEVAKKEKHLTYLFEDHSALKEHFGYETQLLSAEDLRDEISSKRYFGGLLDEKSVSLNPLKFVRQLAEVAGKSGVSILEDVRVEKLKHFKNGLIAKTRFGDIKSDHCILCTSAYTSQEFSGWTDSHLKIGSYVLTTERLPFPAEELIRRRRAIFDTMNFLSYYRLTSDNRLLFGGRALFDKESPSSIAQSEPILREMMLDVFPELREVSTSHVWGGTLDITLNKMPVFATREKITFSIGFAGHGISLATYFGLLVANQLNGDKTSSPFQVDSIKNVPFSKFQNAYLPLVEKYYRIIDKIN